MMKRALIAFGALAALLVVAFVVVSKHSDSRDWAEITLESVTAMPNGMVTVNLTTRHSNGGGIRSTEIIDGVTYGYGFSRGGGFPFLLSSKGSESMGFSLNPERAPVTGSFTNSELFKRLLLRVGETRRFHVGEPFLLYDFTAGGKHYQCIYRAIGRDEPYEDFPGRPRR
jgi:hypothetical protein